ncbi:hypothetical protein [Carboxylicivirga sp. N1Y90]|uniref:hypothetical protein n=1 Tax=Carboxylicivirga fragile TaxID=3417571 RepID=UPI003D332CB5
MDYIGLLFSCPKGEESINCPFCQLRSEGLVNGLNRWKAMPVKKRNGLINAHLHCSLRDETFDCILSEINM